MRCRADLATKVVAISDADLVTVTIEVHLAPTGKPFIYLLEFGGQLVGTNCASLLNEIDLEYRKHEEKTSKACENLCASGSYEHTRYDKEDNGASDIEYRLKIVIDDPLSHCDGPQGTREQVDY